MEQSETELEGNSPNAVLLEERLAKILKLLDKVEKCSLKRSKDEGIDAFERDFQLYEVCVNELGFELQKLDLQNIFSIIHKLYSGMHKILRVTLKGTSHCDKLEMQNQNTVNIEDPISDEVFEPISLNSYYFPQQFNKHENMYKTESSKFNTNKKAKVIQSPFQQQIQQQQMQNNNTNNTANNISTAQSNNTNQVQIGSNNSQQQQQIQQYQQQTIADTQSSPISRNQMNTQYTQFGSLIKDMGQQNVIQQQHQQHNFTSFEGSLGGVLLQQENERAFTEIIYQDTQHQASSFFMQQQGTAQTELSANGSGGGRSQQKLQMMMNRKVQRKKIYNDNKPIIYCHRSTDTGEDFRDSTRNYDRIQKQNQIDKIVRENQESLEIIQAFLKTKLNLQDNQFSGVTANLEEIVKLLKQSKHDAEMTIIGRHQQEELNPAFIEQVRQILNVQFKDVQRETAEVVIKYINQILQERRQREKDMELKQKQQRKILKNNEINQIKEKYQQEVNQYKDKVQYMENKQDDMNKFLKNKDDEIKESKVLQAVLVKQIDKLNGEINSLKSQNQSVKNDATNLQAEIKAKQNLIDDINQAKAIQEQTIEDANKRLLKQKEEMSNLEYENMKLKFEIDKIKELSKNVSNEEKNNIEKMCKLLVEGDLNQEEQQQILSHITSILISQDNSEFQNQEEYLQNRKNTIQNMLNDCQDKVIQKQKQSQFKRIRSSKISVTSDKESNEVLLSNRKSQQQSQLEISPTSDLNDIKDLLQKSSSNIISPNSNAGGNNNAFSNKNRTGQKKKTIEKPSDAQNKNNTGNTINKSFSQNQGGSKTVVKKVTKQKVVKDESGNEHVEEYEEEQLVDEATTEKEPTEGNRSRNVSILKNKNRAVSQTQAASKKQNTKIKGQKSTQMEGEVNDGQNYEDYDDDQISEGHQKGDSKQSKKNSKKTKKKVEKFINAQGKEEERIIEIPIDQDSDDNEEEAKSVEVEEEVEEDVEVVLENGEKKIVKQKQKKIVRKKVAAIGAISQKKKQKNQDQGQNDFGEFGENLNDFIEKVEQVEKEVEEIVEETITNENGQQVKIQKVIKKVIKVPQTIKILKAAIKRTDSGREVIDQEVIKEYEEKLQKEDLIRMGAIQRTNSGREIILNEDLVKNYKEADPNQRKQLKQKFLPQNMQSYSSQNSNNIKKKVIFKQKRTDSGRNVEISEEIEDEDDTYSHPNRGGSLGGEKYSHQSSQKERLQTSNDTSISEGQQQLRPVYEFNANKKSTLGNLAPNQQEPEQSNVNFNNKSILAPLQDAQAPVPMQIKITKATESKFVQTEISILWEIVENILLELGVDPSKIDLVKNKYFTNNEHGPGSSRGGLQAMSQNFKQQQIEKQKLQDLIQQQQQQQQQQRLMTEEANKKFSFFNNNQISPSQHTNTSDSKPLTRQYTHQDPREHFEELKRQRTFGMPSESLTATKNALLSIKQEDEDLINLFCIPSNQQNEGQKQEEDPTYIQQQLEVIDEKLLLKDIIIKKMYLHVREHKDRGADEVRQLINKHLKRNADQTITYDEFKNYYFKIMTIHQRCGDYCPHLIKFFQKIGFTTNKYLNKKELKPALSKPLPFGESTAIIQNSSSQIFKKNNNQEQNTKNKQNKTILNKSTQKLPKISGLF